MKTTVNYFLLLSSLILFNLGCSSDDDGSGDMTNGQNTAPANFFVTVGITTSSASAISWTASSDADGDTVTYTVNLEDTEVATNLSSLSYSFSNLVSATTYSGTVEANDGNGGITTADFSFTTEDEVTSSLHQAFTEFDANNVTIMLNGDSVIIESNGWPNHVSPYWSNTTPRTAIDPMGNTLVTPAAAENHPLFVEPTVTSYEQMAPGNIDDFNGFYTLTIPVSPTLANNSSATGLGPIGIAISGAMIYNDEEGPNIPLDNAVGSLDFTAAHTGPQSYHYHLEPKAWSDDDGALIGIMADGFFIYGRRDYDGNYPTDLDESGGHFGPTPHNPDGEYHYHIKNELYLNQYYIIFPDDYQGTPNSIN